MDTTTPTRGRLTPTMTIVLIIALVLLTASGCGTGPTDSVAHPNPPMEETAGRAAAMRAPEAVASDDQPAPALARIKTPKTPAAPRSTEVHWTTAEPGYRAPAATPAVEVAFTTDTPATEDLSAVAPATEEMASVDTADLDASLDLPTDAEPTPAPPTEPAADLDLDLDVTDAEPEPLALFYVFGEVEHAGPYHHTGRNRVIDIIAQVKPTRRANPAKVMLIRPAADDATEATVFEINVDRMIREGDLSQNQRLEAGDILYIPPSGGARVGLALGSLLGAGGDEAPDHEPAETRR